MEEQEEEDDDEEVSEVAEDEVEQYEGDDANDDAAAWPVLEPIAPSKAPDTYTLFI